MESVMKALAEVDLSAGEMAMLSGGAIYVYDRAEPAPDRSAQGQFNDWMTGMAELADQAA